MKSVLITGASSGIGEKIAQLFSEHGYKTILVGRNKLKLNRLSIQLNNSSFHIADFNQPEEVDKLCNTLLEQGEPLHALINNAGIVEYSNLDNASTESLHKQFQVNFFSVFQLTKKLKPLLTKNTPSFVVNIASTLGLKPIKDTGIYSASKAAMINWTKTLALEWAGDGVRANAIAPGLVDTPIHAFHKLDPSHQDRKFVDTLQPLKRIGRPEEIAHMAFLLTQPHSEWTTGSIITIDGGIQLL